MSAPICLYVFVVSLVFGGTPECGSRFVSHSFFLFLGYFSSCWVTLSSLVTRFFPCLIVFFFMVGSDLLYVCFFLTEQKGGMHLKERGGGAMLGCLKGEKTIVGMY